MRRTAAAMAMMAALGMAGLGAPAAVAGEPRTFTVGIENIEYYPEYAVRDGEYVGFARALLDSFAKSQGYRFVYRPLPVARLFVQFLGGKLDFKYPDNPLFQVREKAGKTVLYSDPVVGFVDGVSVLPARLAASPPPIRRLGTVLGFTPTSWADAIAGKSVELMENPSFPALLTVTLAGHVDGAYGNVAVTQYVLEHVLHRPGALVYDPRLPHTASHYHLSTLAHGPVIAEFNAWMQRESAAVQELKQRYAVEAVDAAGGPAAEPGRLAAAAR